MSAYGFAKSTLETSHKGEVRYSGSFATNGSDAPAAASIRGNWITSITHSGTGEYTITMATPYKNVVGLICGIATLQLAAAGLSFAQLGPIDLSAGTVIVRTFTESTGTIAQADIAAAAGNAVHLSLTFKYANIKDGAGV